MAGVDPKDLAKKNAALIAIYVLTILPLVLWYVLVEDGVYGARKDSFIASARQLGSNITNINSMINSINDPETRVYTQRDIDRLNEQHALYRKVIGDLKATLYDKDQALERWFDQYSTLKEGEEPKPNDYITHYNKKIKELTAEFADLVTPEDGGPPNIYRQPPPRNQLRTYQKRYWIQQCVLEAIRDGTEAARKRGEPGAKVVQAIRFTEARKGTGDGSAALVDRIPANIVFTCSIRDVPAVIQKLLSQPVAMQITALKLVKESFLRDDPEKQVHIDGRGGYFPDVYYTGELETHDKYEGDDKQHVYIPEPSVRLNIDLAVLDFGVPKPAPPAPAPE